MSKPIKKNNYKILLVDDSQLDRELSTMVLTKNGYNVISVGDTTTVIKTFEVEKPDLILLDIMMPKVNGNDLLLMLRTRKNSLELPIIMLTAKTETKDIVQSLNLGANDYILKPVEYDVALRRIKNHLDIAKLSKELSQVRELDTIRNIVETFTQEIRNPVTIISELIERYKIQLMEDDNYQLVADALAKVASTIQNTNSELLKFNLKTDKM